jgi:UDP-glucose 4-epimerase
MLVTGGAGYIGSHACKALSPAGYLSVTHENMSRGNERAVRWAPLERGDIADGAQLSDAMARHRPVVLLCRRVRVGAVDLLLQQRLRQFAAA